MSSREIIQRLEAAGWQRIRVRGSHWQFKHPDRSGKATVPHPRHDIRGEVLRSIERQSGVSLRRES